MDGWMDGWMMGRGEVGLLPRWTNDLREQRADVDILCVQSIRRGDQETGG